MHAGGLLCTQRVRVALYNACSNSYASFVLITSHSLPRASITQWLHPGRLPFLERSDKTSECKEKEIAPQINNWKKRGGTPFSVFNVAFGQTPWKRRDRRNASPTLSFRFPLSQSSSTFSPSFRSLPTHK